MDEEPIEKRNSKDTLLKNLKKVLKSLENARELFDVLLRSYPSRFDAIKAAGGGHTNY